MTKIGLISDTHGFLHPRVEEFLSGCDEIWHSGDVGDYQVINRFESTKTVRAVFGNIDGREVRTRLPKYQIFHCEQVKVVMTHIGGYPGRYEKEARERLETEKPNIFISGHSHILKIIYDKKRSLLHLNPGAAGNNGFHNSITALRFKIEGADILEMEILDIKRSNVIS